MKKTNWKDMREFLDFLEERNDVLHIKEEVDPDWEVNGITLNVTRRQGPVVIFDKVRGADLPLVTGLVASNQRFLWAFGIEGFEGFNEEWARRTRQLIPPKIVETAVCQEETVSESDIDLNRMCNVIWHQHDVGPYPGTMSISITKDPDTGVQNAAIYRMGTLGKNRLGWGAPPYSHGRVHYTKYEKRGEPMPMAVITGNDPIVCMAGGTKTVLGIDEFHIAGALRGEPLEMVKCKTIDILVPAYSEMVFEGFVYPGVREMEGGFGEYTGYYGEARSNPVFEIKAITHRKNPMYLGTREQWWPSESALIVSMSTQGEAFKTLKTLVPGLLNLKKVASFEVIAQIDKQYRGHPQQVIDAVWGYLRIKHVIVVDKDVDPFDYERVHWALCTRVKADRDVYISPRRSGWWLDPAVPLKEKGWQTGLGIDATMPTEEYEFWGEKAPLTVDDPEIEAKTKEKWGNKLKLS